VRVLGCALLGSGREGELVFVDVDLHVTKGYYVRSFARDLGAALGVPAHLRALRRLASGPFSLARASPLDAPPATLIAAVVPLATAATEALGRAMLTEEGATRARQGKRLGEQDFVAAPPRGGSAAWLDGSGRLVAVGERVAAAHDAEPGDVMVVQRGFVA
jgi:tRNA pseudouridine55 synthase